MIFEYEPSREAVEKIVNADGYMYSSDLDNGLSQNGIDPEKAVGILIEMAMEKLQEFDALVLIHPDYLKVKKMQVYKRTLEEVVKRCIEQGKAVFCLQFDEKDESGLSNFIFQDTIPFPRLHEVFDQDEEEQKYRDSLQQEVDYIADILEKAPADIKLAWGGMLGDLCVCQWRDGRCLITSPEFESFSRHEGRNLQNPISYGESLPEITVY